MTSSLPIDFFYTSEHEWAKEEEQVILIGITDHAQHALGDVVFVELPEEGTAIEKGRPIGVVESVKAVSDLYAPISGIVRAVNRKVIDSPELLNKDPYGQGWMLKIEPTDKSQLANLLDHRAYGVLLNKEAKHQGL
jgi:glycine cleavage system H protein